MIRKRTSLDSLGHAWISILLRVDEEEYVSRLKWMKMKQHERKCLKLETSTTAGKDIQIRLYPFILDDNETDA
jgi:hypothetical protein